MSGPRTGRIAAVPALALLAAASGCATITYDAPLLETMVAMNHAAPTAAYEHVGDFELDRRPVFLIAQLITVVDAELEDALSRELARSGGDAVINLRIHEEYDFVDVVISVVAGGLVDTRSVTLRGDVIRWTGDRGAGPEALLDLSDRCRSVAVPTAEGGSRTGYACLPVAAP